MSGAALSPSMGKLTYRPLTFLLGLANIRLGVWVPNPRCVPERKREEGQRRFLKTANRLRDTRDATFQRPHPHYLLKEILGQNRLDDEFLYVTDGGHYENLGLVELLRRGCTRIYCFDAGGGKTSAALGDAIAIARTELNIEITMHDAASLAEDDDGLTDQVCAHGTITFRDGTEGELVYARSLLAKTSAWDLQCYKGVDAVFPHHSTFDQFFNDQKFEAYRRLGWCAADKALKPYQLPPTVEQADTIAPDVDEGPAPAPVP
jgi:hypothetical protein